MSTEFLNLFPQRLYTIATLAPKARTHSPDFSPICAYFLTLLNFMETVKNFNTYFLARDDVRIWVRSCHLDLLSPTSAVYMPGLSASRLSLMGMVFRCDLLSTFFYGGSQDLRVKAIPPDLSEVVIETWHTNDRKTYTLEHIFRLYNVVPGVIKHAECTCCCGGDIDIEFEKIEICEANKKRIELKEEGWFDPEYLKEPNNGTKIVLNKE